MRPRFGKVRAAACVMLTKFLPSFTVQAKKPSPSPLTTRNSSWPKKSRNSTSLYWLWLSTAKKLTWKWRLSSVTRYVTSWFTWTSFAS